MFSGMSSLISGSSVSYFALYIFTFSKDSSTSKHVEEVNRETSK